MHDAVPSCFRGGGDAETRPPASARAGPRVTTSVYETPLGAAALTWYRTALGLSLHVDLLLPSPASTPCSDAGRNAGAFRFRLRPWLLWKRRGTKRFYLNLEEDDDDRSERRQRTTAVDFAWDLARARFPPGGGPEPAASFFVAVAIDGDTFLVVGDMVAEAYKKTPSKEAEYCSLLSATLVSRREHAVVLPRSGRWRYTTRASLDGKEREVSIDLEIEEGSRDSKLSVVLDGGYKVLHVRRLRWKFRGSEEVVVDGGGRVRVSWDVHRWLFGRGLHPLPPASAAAAASEPGHAVLLLRFDRDGEVEACSGNHRRGDGGGEGLLGLNRVGSPFSGGAVEFPRRSGRRRKLLRTRSSSSSSSSSASWGSGSSVMEWASGEDAELQGSDAFSLVVNLWKG